MAIDAQVPASAELELYESAAHELELNFGDVSLRPQKVYQADTFQLLNLMQRLHDFTAANGSSPTLDELRNRITAIFNSPTYWHARQDDNSMNSYALARAISLFESDLENVDLLEGIFKSAMFRGYSAPMNLDELHSICTSLFMKSRFDLLRAFTEALAQSRHPLADQLKSDYINLSQIYTVDALSRNFKDSVGGDFAERMKYASTTIYDFQTQAVDGEKVLENLDLYGQTTDQVVETLANILVNSNQYFGAEVARAVMLVQKWEKFPTDAAIQLLKNIVDAGKVTVAEKFVHVILRKTNPNVSYIQLKMYQHLAEVGTESEKEIARWAIQSLERTNNEAARKFEASLLQKFETISLLNSQDKSGLILLDQIRAELVEMENEGVMSLQNPALSNNIRWYYDITSANPIAPEAIEVPEAIARITRYIKLCEALGTTIDEQKEQLEADLISKLIEVERLNSTGASGIAGLKQMLQILKEIELEGISEFDSLELRKKMRWYYDITSADPMTPSSIIIPQAIAKLTRYISLCESLRSQREERTELEASLLAEV